MLRSAVVAVLLFSSATAAARSGSGIELGPEREPEVVGGTLVSQGSWRDAAAVYFGPRNQGPSCTGVLVAPNVVLTAGHCLGGITEVLLGATSWVEPDGEFISVQASYGHPTLDIAALVLAQDATVPPRVIAAGCATQRFLANGADVAIVGYGAIDSNASQLSSGLREAFSTVVDFDCSFRSGCRSPGKELGAGGNGIDSCNGDSGGPLYLLTEHYDYLVGTTSRAFSDATVPCSQGGIYVRPDAAIDWIEEVTGATIPRATCNTPPDPSAETLYTLGGKLGSTKISPNDVDADNTHRYLMVRAPMFGEGGTDEEGKAYYRSFDEGYEGTDSFEVEVIDDGVPALSSRLTIQVQVAQDVGCGCRATTIRGQDGLWLLVALLAVRRRRRGR